MSGEELARLVGYSHQSSIGNLENRAGGTGGGRIGQIADALCVPVDWLLRGPDGDNVPFVNATEHKEYESKAPQTCEERPGAYVSLHPVEKEALELLSQMTPEGREQCLGYLRYMASQYRIQSPSAGGERDSIPHQKAA